jgi:hypothetical protein
MAFMNARGPRVKPHHGFGPLHGRCLVSLIWFVSLPNDGSAFDGHREGFLIGYGGGVGVIDIDRRVASPGVPAEDRGSEGEFVLTTVLGYAPRSSVAAIATAKFSPLTFNNNPPRGVFGMLGGGVRYHFLDRGEQQPKSLFLDVAIGYVEWASTSAKHRGSSYTAGIGLETRRAPNLKLDYLYGKRSHPDLNVHALVFTLELLHY